MSPSRNLRIRDVYEDNLEQEFELIKDVVDEFPHIAMDTEFPGVVVRPLGSFNSNSAFRYQTLRLNVDILKLIQLGLTFTDDHGNLPTCGTDEFCVWQFNFKEFRMEKDFFAHDSIQLLKQSGIDFKKNESQGCDAQRFAELLMSSGVVLNENVHWITFQSSYDFAYLLKLLTGQRLPDEEDMFLDRLKLYFPSIYDIKYLIKFCNNLHGGLNRIAETLDVARIGPSHQAGSDSLLTSGIFWKLRKKYFNDHIEEYAGVVSGLGIDGDSVIGMNQL